MRLTAPQKQLLQDARNLELVTRDPSVGALVSGARYRTALALERKGLGHVRYQGPSLGWFTLVKREVFYTGDLVESDDSRLCLICNQGTPVSPNMCRECGKPMHPSHPSKGEPGMHWCCDDERCGTWLFVLTDPDDGPDPVAVCDNEQCQHRFETEDELKEFTANTNVYGEPTMEGHGEVMSSGWVDADWTLWEVYEEQEHVSPDVMDQDDEEEVQTPAEWLAETITSRLGGVQEYDGGNTFYASDSIKHHYDGKEITLAAHPKGFSDEEMRQAWELIKS